MADLVAPPARDSGSAGPTTAAPTFSILIAAYQAAGFITDAVESALTQTVPPLEVVVVDDASTDDLKGALAPYDDDVVLLHHTTNRGPGATKNTAARHARGDYLVLLDADDAYLPQRLEALAQAATSRPDLDILVTDAFVEHEGRVVGRAYHPGWLFDVEDQRRAILDRCFIVGHAAVKRTRFEEVGGFDDERRTVDDWDLWLRMILTGSRAGLIPEALSRYRVREGSVSTNLLGVLRGGVQILERAGATQQLSDAERAVLASSLGRQRRELALLEAREALRTRRDDARRRLIGIATRRDYSLRTRIKAASSAVLLGRASRRLQQRDAATWVGAAGVHVEGRRVSQTRVSGG